ncbi:TonB-dependent receptor [Sphingosinicella xenopeptidilytica]|uniref:TonB-dependent receptor n=1 Tax=Sphingosinicella xenopeptidilytica TaxID=364098 RepID=A0ABW3C9S5_SPHXN
MINAQGKTRIALGAVMLLSGTTLARAQDYQAEDIVITAAKRSESLQTVPISVSAIGGDALAERKITRADDLVSVVPNLQLSSIVGSNTPIFSLRGVSMFDYSLNQSSPVATYYDEVYKGNFAFLGVAMYDLERVEVLRGPQGTLYGKNTSGGAVNLISRAPKLGETEGNLNFGYGNYNRFDASGAINLPMSDVLAARVAFTVSRADGWFKNQTPGQPDMNGVREYGIRGSLLFAPSDSARFVLRASTSLQNPTNYGIYAQPADLHRAGLSKREIESNIGDIRRHARTWSVSLNGTVDVADGLALTSVTSWDKGNLRFKEDTDGTAERFVEITYTDRATQFAQDLRLTSEFAGPFNFILGGYYNREKVFNSNSPEYLLGFDFDGEPGLDEGDCLAGFILGCGFTNSFDQLKKSYAIYTDMSFEISDVVKLRGGLRYTHDKGRQDYHGSYAYAANGGFVTDVVPALSQAYSKNNLSGKIGVDFQIGDQLLYANYSRGYRANSFNAQAFFDPSELTVAKPEKINAYEIGAKTRFADRRATLNVAAFYYDYRNQQYVNVDPLIGTQVLVNLPKSRILGGEAEFTMAVSEALTLNSALGIIDAKVRKGIVGGVDVGGNRLPNAPKLTLSGGFDATLHEGDIGRIGLRGDVSYVSGQYFEVMNVSRLRQGGYALLSGSLNWTSADERWTAALWAKNLTNEFYFTSRVDLLAGFGYDYNHVSTPRTYGATVGVRF